MSPDYHGDEAHVRPKDEQDIRQRGRVLVLLLHRRWSSRRIYLLRRRRGGSVSPAPAVLRHASTRHASHLELPVARFEETLRVPRLGVDGGKFYRSIDTARRDEGVTRLAQRVGAVKQGRPGLCAMLVQLFGPLVSEKLFKRVNKKKNNKKKVKTCTRRCGGDSKYKVDFGPYRNTTSTQRQHTSPHPRRRAALQHSWPRTGTSNTSGYRPRERRSASQG